MKTIYLLLLLLLVASLLVGCAPATPTSAPAEEEELPAAPGEVPTLRIAVPQYMLDDGLESTLRSTAEKSGLSERLDFTLEGYSSIPPGMKGMCISPDLPYLFPDSVVEGAYPDLMLVDSQAVYQFEPTLMSEVPPAIRDAVGLTESARSAYSDMDGRLVGLAQGTRPVMMVYNRGSFGEHPVVQGLASGGQPILQWGEMNTIRDKLAADNNVLSMPPMAALLAAEIQGMGRNPEEIFDNPAMLLDLATEYGSEMDSFFGSGNVASFDPGQMQPFENPQTAFTLVDSGYLGQLADSGQQVDVLPLPALASGQMATSTQMLGWVVPAKASYTEQAWELASTLVQDAEMNRFGLRYGLLPTTEAGVDSLGEWASSSLLAPGNLQTLKDLARYSIAWHIPARFRTAECRQKFNDFMMESDQLVAQLADKSLSGMDAASKAAEFLYSIQSCSP